MSARMKRRELLLAFGGAAVASSVSWPHPAPAQQPAMPVIGFLGGSTADVSRQRAFRRGLTEAGHTEGESVAVEYRWAENVADRLPALAAELVRRRVAVIVASGNAAALAAKSATNTIPIVFSVSEDPVRIGLVASIAQPGGNATGINFLAAELTAKRLEFLRVLLPQATLLGVLVDPSGPVAATIARDVETAASAMGLKTRILNVSTNGEINAAFMTFARERPHALFVSGGFLFTSRRMQLALRAAHHSIPAIYANRDYVEAGGLMSYGANLTDTHRQVGLYVGRILKGTKPADLPVMQSTKFELVLNIETARMLGLELPPQLLALADEVIE